MLTHRQTLEVEEAIDLLDKIYTTHHAKMDERERIQIEHVVATLRSLDER